MSLRTNPDLMKADIPGAVVRAPKRMISMSPSFSRVSSSPSATHGTVFH